MVINKLHEVALRSEHAYWAAFASIGGSFASWPASNKVEPAGVDRADRRGIFAGQWVPASFGLGLALSQYEQRDGSL